MPPASATDRGLNLSLQLGTEYERKKQKLLQELQLDYKHYVTQKKDVKTSERRPPPLGLSLPIDENLSEKEKLREERRREYNLFLQENAQTRRLKRRTPSVPPPAAAPLLPPPPLNTRASAATPRPASRRDAATLTEAEDHQGRGGRSWERRQRRRRRLLLCRPIDAYSSEEEEPFTDEDSPEPEDQQEKSMRERRDKMRGPKEAEARRVRDHNLQKPERLKVAPRPNPATDKDTAEFATGLLIGATEEQAASQMRKERYKLELLKQIAEEQRNKMREKKLELRVAATGATDPEKKPDRIKQFGAGRQRRGDSLRRDGGGGGPFADLDVKEPDLDKPRKSGNAAPRLPSLDYFNEKMSNMLRDAIVPRVAGVPPPLPPTVTNHYTTPYDAAYYYYGARNPLDHSPPHYQNDLAARLQEESTSLHSPPQEPPPPPLKPSHRSEPTDPHRPSSSSLSSSPLYVAELPVDEAKQRRENALSYQEALRQQIKEREERKRREKQERERYDAKIEAEMTAYNPWGRSGGGAPIKDQEGNLFSDLKQMHRSNKEAFENHASESEASGEQTNGDARHVQDNAAAAVSHGPSVKPQQLCTKDRYKEELKEQIEENKRLQAEERERERIEEEKEERRLTVQRIRMQREYEEEELRKLKKIQNKTETQSWTNEPQTRRREEEKTATTTTTRPPVVREVQSRAPSPPVPALQRISAASRAPSAASRLSSSCSSSTAASRRSVSAPHYPSAPGRTAQLLQDGHDEVIRQLSALRRVLRKEQEQLEGQMDKREDPSNRSRRRRSPAVLDAFESARRDTDEPSTAKTYSVSAREDMRNIREFNQLKYRETSSREEVLHMFPDPPTDALSLDIQQQALLRQQRRKIRLMRGEEDGDSLDLQLSRYYPRIKPERRIHKDSVLPSETAFIVLSDVYSDEEEETQETPQLPESRRDSDAQSLLLSNSPPEVRGHDRRRRRDSGDHSRNSD